MKHRLFKLLILMLAWGVLPSHAITRSLTYNGSTLSTATNTKTTVSQLQSDITLSNNVDYIITAQEGKTAMAGYINITDDRSTVIFANIRPSIVVNNWLRYIKINGATAVNGTNCRVETYRHGTIVLPYPTNCHPLTVYTQMALGGQSNNLYNVKTYYNNLGDFNNAIQSFTLKRGYMVTMANHADGTGYSHCFIANDGDITVTLPKDMRGSVSFLRIFPWRWPSKKGYAGRTLTPMNLMRVTWYYQWNAENYQDADYDYVPQRHHENGNTYTGTATYAWPSWDVLNTQSSAHVLGVNEPDNTSGSEMYMTVPNLIKKHAEYLRSGMRIGTFATCNPNVGWVKAYVDSCEAHNFRVDFVATHYYIGGQKPENCIASLKSLYDATGLPVWCTEWNNGANWTNETSFYTDSLKSWYQWGSGDDQKMNGIWLRDVLKRADYAENTGWLERMAIYNNVGQKRFVHWESDDFWTTAGGELYGSYNSDFAYKKTSDVWMNWHDQGDPHHLAAGYSVDGNSILLTWSDPNTDWTKTIYVQQRSGTQWMTRATLGVCDDEWRETSLDVATCTGDKVFRIMAIDAIGKTHYSNEVDLSDNNTPNGFMKFTTIPDNYDDYYYAICSKNKPSLCWTLANATPTDDYTSLVGTGQANWQGASGTVTGNGIALVELYNSSSAGTKMSQTVNSLPNGIYSAVLYATSHNARGENGATLNGTRDDVAYVFATASGQTQKTYFTASGITPGFLPEEPHECVISDIRVTNGTLTLGLGLDKSNVTGWHCIQIKSLTRTGNIEGVETGESAFKAVHYNTMVETGSHLGQVWQIENNAASSGYTLRSPALHDDVLCSPSSNLFQTDGRTHLGNATSGYLPIYDATNDCWRMQNVKYSTYCGVGATPTEDAEVKGDMNQAHADQLIIYAIRKTDFNQIYIVEKGNHQANYTIDNPNLSWGTVTGPTSGSGRVEYPACWTFLKTFGGWNDAFCGSAELSDGHVGAFFNAWAGTLTYAELLQEVNSLPNGVYRLTADFATTQDYSRTTTKTALYGNAGEGNIARSYNITGTGDNSFNRYECYVLVTGNKMTIGARSDGTWFKVADFHLEYVCQEGEASEEIRGYLDNGRALQHQCWRMNDEWLDLSAFPECRNLQVDQIPTNAIVKMAPNATVDASYNSSNIVKDGKCAHLVITDEEPLTVAETFEAEKVTYIRHDSPDEWHQLFLPFTVGASNNLKVGMLSRKSGNTLFGRYANGNMANTPALVRFSDTNITLQHVNVSPTVEYDNEEWGIHGTYHAGNNATPLRWKVDGNEDFDEMNIIFLGDVNRDGLITITDVIALVNIVLGMDMTPPYLYDHDAADMNGDGDLTITDITILVNYITSGS
ncbi:MAG: hypothetical protein IKX33_11665 [Prevotella sp.]|nr:hypothetical protein [Prevotella sp.]